MPGAEHGICCAAARRQQQQPDLHQLARHLQGGKGKQHCLKLVSIFPVMLSCALLWFMLCCAAVLQSTHEDKDYIHIVMELCQGGELFDHIVEAQHFTERKVHTAMKYQHPLAQDHGSCVCAVRNICSCAGGACRLHAAISIPSPFGAANCCRRSALLQETLAVVVIVLCVTSPAVLGLPAGCTHLQEDGGGGQPLP
jgi:hypothetical protein